MGTEKIKEVELFVFGCDSTVALEHTRLGAIVKARFPASALDSEQPGTSFRERFGRIVWPSAANCENATSLCKPTS
jgi:hypothetical protein